MFTDTAAATEEPPSATPDALKIRFPQSGSSAEFRKKYFPGATRSDWNNWHWQLQNTIRTADALERIVRLTDDERAAMTGACGGLPTSITPYYAALLDPDTPRH